MNKKLNPALIGAFILGAIAIAVAAVLYYGKGQFQQKQEFIAYFRSQANGLVVGSPVVMQGVPIGTVKAIRIGYSEEQASFYVRTVLQITGNIIHWPEEIRREIERDPENYLPKLIERGLRARLATQSLLTGRLMVELGFYPEDEVILIGEDWEIPTIRTTIEQLSDRLKKIDFDKMTTSIEAAVAGLDNTVQGVNTLIQNLNADQIGNEALLTLKSVNRTLETVNREIGPTLVNFNETLDAIQNLAENANDQLGTVAGSIDRLAVKYGTLADHVDTQLMALAGELRTLADTAQRVLGDVSKATRGAGTLLAENSPLQTELLKTLRSLSAASRSLKSFADYLERHPEALLKGKR